MDLIAKVVALCEGPRGMLTQAWFGWQGIKSQNPQMMAEAIVKATTHYQDASMVAEVSRGLGEAMAGLDVRTMPVEEQLSTRGW